MTDHLRDLVPDPRNARKHDVRNIAMIRDALQEVGAARSIVIDEDNVILAGHGVADAAAEAGIERVRVVEADGNELIAVRRTGLTPAQKARLALFDNRTSDLSDWDAEVLAGLNDDGLLDGLFRDDELARLLGQIDNGPAFDATAAWQGMPPFHQDDLMPVKQLTVSFASADDVARFAQLVAQAVTMTTKSIWYPAQAPARTAELAFVDAELPRGR